MYYKFNEEMINRKYTIKLCSLEKKYIYYRDNFKRLCIDNYKLQKENAELKDNNLSYQEELAKAWKENKELKNKINKVVLMIDDNYRSEWYDDYETIAELRDDIYDLLKIKYKGVKDEE